MCQAFAAMGFLSFNICYKKLIPWVRCYEIQAASVLSFENPCQSYFSRICVCGPVGEHSNDFFSRLLVFLCIYKQTSNSCATSKSSYFWYCGSLTLGIRFCRSCPTFHPCQVNSGVLVCDQSWQGVKSVVLLWSLLWTSGMISVPRESLLQAL